MPKSPLPTINKEAVSTAEPTVPREAESAAVAAATAERIELQSETWSISVPVLIWDSGYARKSIDVRLNEDQANKLKAIQLGLESQEAQLKNGRFVSNAVDALRWIIENIGKSDFVQNSID